MSTTAPQPEGRATEPVGTVHVFDPHPLNWAVDRHRLAADGLGG